MFIGEQLRVGDLGRSEARMSGIAGWSVLPAWSRLRDEINRHVAPVTLRIRDAMWLWGIVGRSTE